MFEELQISSPALGGVRKVWVQKPTVPSKGCCVFLDGDLYVDRVKAPAAVRELIDPTLTCVYLSFGEPSLRHKDFICNPAFSEFLVAEFIPWIESVAGPHEEYFLCGLSLSGLAAVFAALSYPDRFSRVIAQSPSAWWNDEWLAAQCSLATPSECRFWISVGDEETDENVLHAPGLLQKTSQVDSCRRLANSLTAVAQEVRYSKFKGGHDAACWSAELPMALRWLFS